MVRGAQGAVASVGSESTRSVYLFGDSPGFTTKGGGVVDRIVAGSQAEKEGVKKGWRVAAIDGEAVPRGVFDSDLAVRLKKAMARGGECTEVTFLARKKTKSKAEKAVDAKPVDKAKVQQQQSCLRSLDTLSKAERRKNLSDLSRLNSSEAVAVLQDAQTVQGLFSSRGAEELSLLLREMDHSQLEETLDLHDVLSQGRKPSAQEVRRADLAFRDGDGNTAMHLARTATSFGQLLSAAEMSIGGSSSSSAASPSQRRASCPAVALFEVRNVAGETPVQSALRHCASSLPQQLELLKFFSDHVPEVMRDNIPEVIPLLPQKDRAELLRPKIPWPEVRDVLLSGDVSTLQAGFAKLSGTLRAALPSLPPEDHAGAWTELLAEHCFGVLQSGQDGAEDSSARLAGLRHCEASRERLGAVWQALRRLLEACASPSLPKEEAGELKDITKGLLNATRGPSCPALDPREPYREAFGALVCELQHRTAVLLGDSLKAAIKAEASAAEELQAVPRDELRGVDTSRASTRGAPGRLRMDSPLAADPLRDGAGGDTGAALEAPDWVEEQSLSADLFEDLKRWGCVERACDILDIVGGTGHGTIEELPAAVQEGFSEDRLRFCRLHAAWLRGTCSEAQLAIAERLRAAVGLKGTGPEGPWEAAGGSKVTLFRTRAEAKGLPRILEKMHEALGEEVLVGRTLALLRQQRAESAPEAPAGGPDTDDEDLKAKAQQASALRDLLTPACYICDVNGAEVVVDSLHDMLALFKHLMSLSLQKDQCQVVRIKNGFSSQLSAAEVDAKGGYRDLKLWLMIVVEDVRLVAELQVHLRCFHELKRVMHLPYECSRGSFDHAHLAGLWHQGRAFSLKCCSGCAIS